MRTAGLVSSTSPSRASYQRSASASLPGERQHHHHQRQQQQHQSESSTAATPNNKENNIGSRLFSTGMAAEARKRQWAAEERLKGQLRSLQLEDCTFTPAITKRASSLTRPRSLSPENRIALEQQKKLIRISEGQQERDKKELEKCTFHPLILDVAQLNKPRANRVDPDVFHALHRESEVRAAWHEKNREAAAAALYARSGKGAVDVPKLSKEKLEQVVLRLMRPTTSSTPSEEDDEDVFDDDHGGADNKRHNNNRRRRTPSPTISKLTETIIRMRRSENDDRRSVFERLSGVGGAGGVDGGNEEQDTFENQQRVDRIMRQAFANFTHRPNISRESDLLATEVRRLTLEQLYNHLCHVLVHSGERKQKQKQPVEKEEEPEHHPTPAARLLLPADSSSPSSSRAASADRSPSSSFSPASNNNNNDEQKKKSKVTFDDEREAEAFAMPECLDIVDIARASSCFLSLQDSKDIMEGLTNSGKTTFTRSEFVEAQIQELRRTGPKNYLRAISPNAHHHRLEQNATHRQGRLRAGQLAPEFHEPANKIRYSAHLSREDLNVLKEKRLQRVMQERLEKLTKECTFKPKITPHESHSKKESSVVSSVSDSENGGSGGGDDEQQLQEEGGGSYADEFVAQQQQLLSQHHQMIMRMQQEEEEEEEEQAAAFVAAPAVLQRRRPASAGPTSSSSAAATSSSSSSRLPAFVPKPSPVLQQQGMMMMSQQLQQQQQYRHTAEQDALRVEKLFAAAAASAMGEGAVSARARVDQQHLATTGRLPTAHERTHRLFYEQKLVKQHEERIRRLNEEQSRKSSTHHHQQQRSTSASQRRQPAEKEEGEGDAKHNVGGSGDDRYLKSTAPDLRTLGAQLMRQQLNHKQQVADRRQRLLEQKRREREQLEQDRKMRQLLREQQQLQEEQEEKSPSAGATSSSSSSSAKKSSSSSSASSASQPRPKVAAAASSSREGSLRARSTASSIDDVIASVDAALNHGDDE